VYIRFRRYGKVALAKVVRDEDTGRSRGTAFVKFEDKESASAALERASSTVLGPLECDGRAITATMAVDRKQAASLANTNERLREEEKAKKAKDTRNLYLLRHGLIMSNTAAYQQMSTHDRDLRRKLEMEAKAKVCALSRTHALFSSCLLTCT
jgi:nucleolar protein 4